MLGRANRAMDRRLIRSVYSYPITREEGTQTKDNYDFFKDYDREQAEWEAHLPRCASCGEPIQDEDMYDIDGWYCEECKDVFLANVRKNVTDWMDEQKGVW